MPLGSRQPTSFSEEACESREFRGERCCHTPFLGQFLRSAARFSAGFCVCGLTRARYPHTSHSSTDFAVSRFTRQAKQLLDLCARRHLPSQVVKVRTRFSPANLSARLLASFAHLDAGLLVRRCAIRRFRRSAFPLLQFHAIARTAGQAVQPAGPAHPALCAARGGFWRGGPAADDGADLEPL